MSSCGPFKLGMVLNQCLKRFDSSYPQRTPYKHGTDPHDSQSHGSDLIADLAPRLGLYPPLVLRTKSNNDTGQIVRPPNATQEKSEPAVWTEPHRVLVVDDNAINRRLLSVFLKKRKIRFGEAKDGKEALEAYADEKFDIVLMDVSMP
jgi:hypothetical protein